MNPDSPLGVSGKGERQGLKLHLELAGGAYRKTVLVSFLGVPVDARVLFWISFRSVNTDWLRLKVPAPEPPGRNWDKLGWAK